MEYLDYLGLSGEVWTPQDCSITNDIINLNGRTYRRNKMASKKYSCGLVIGRFQPPHKGHMAMIDEALKECHLLIVAIGSAQKYGTFENPLRASLRAEILEEATINKNVVIIGIDDREQVINDQSWGDYLLKQVSYQLGFVPEVIFQGNDAIRKQWFDNNSSIEVKCLNRANIPISATKLREEIIKDNREFYDKWSLVPCDRYYNKLREVLK